MVYLERARRLYDSPSTALFLMTERQIQQVILNNMPEIYTKHADEEIRERCFVL